MIAAGPARPIWPGRVGGRLFLTMASSGFDAEMIAAVNPRLKRYVGRLAFAWAILMCLWWYRACELSVRVEGVEHHAATVIAAKGRFYAGSYVIAPRADLAEPTLDFVLLRRAGRLAVLRYLGALLLGRVTRRKDITVPACARARRFRPPRRSPVQADGEIVARLPVSLGIAEQPCTWSSREARSPSRVEFLQQHAAALRWPSLRGFGSAARPCRLVGNSAAGWEMVDE